MESEYEHCYGPEQFACSVNSYRNNLAFRKRLRSRSQGHDNHPFIWEDASESDEDDTRGNSTVRNSHHSRHTKSPHVSDKNTSSQTDLTSNPDTQECACETEPDAEFMNDTYHEHSPEKETQTPQGWYGQEKPPFALYGSRDEESEIGRKKTFNIRASKEIFPSALRAMRRRRMRDSDSSFEQVKKAQSTPSFSDSKRHREVLGWETEYERAYKAPDPSSYEEARYSKPMHVLSPDLIPSTPRKHQSYLSVE